MSRELLYALTEIETGANENGWNETLETKYNNIDQEITKIMLSAEQTCAPIQNNKHPWSVALKEACLTYRY